MKSLENNMEDVNFVQKIDIYQLKELFEKGKISLSNLTLNQKKELLKIYKKENYEMAVKLNKKLDYVISLKNK